ncbi:hypothetical protein N2152v2_006274 [Parachlorella kessleri]
MLKRFTCFQGSLLVQVTESAFDPADYSNSMAAAARGRQNRFMQQATAGAPYACQPGEAGRYPEDVHLIPRGKEVVGKVNASASVDREVYCASLQQMAQGKQDRFYQAATATAPYAVLAPGGTDPGKFPADYVPVQKHREVMGKPCNQQFNPAHYEASISSQQSGKLDRYNRAASAAAPFAQGESGPAGGADDRWGPPGNFHARPRKHSQEVNGKVNVEVFGPDMYASTKLANQLDAQSTRTRNHGIPGLLRQDDN